MCFRERDAFERVRMRMSVGVFCVYHACMRA